MGIDSWARIGSKASVSELKQISALGLREKCTSQLIML